MKKNLLFLVLAVLILAGCSRGFKSGNGDLLYEIYTDKDGPKIAEGDFISYNMITKTEGDSVLLDTHQMGYPRFNILPPPVGKGDLNEAMTLLTEGDSAIFKVSADLIFENRKKPAYIKGKYLVYVVKIEKVIHKQGLGFTEFNARVINYKNGVSEARKYEEPRSIKKYIADNKLVGTTTPSGLFYTITKPGTGDKAMPGDTIELNLVSSFINKEFQGTNIREEAIKNNRFDPTAPYMPIRLTVGQSGIASGLNEASQYLNKGAKGTFILPSNIAY
ncbi:MAG: FKBP-type peptidylprolyl isomerase, partial [Mucilaginibacter sp.]